MVLLRQQNKGQQRIFLLLQLKKNSAGTKRFVDRTKHFVAITIFFVFPILTNDFVGITKPFIQCVEYGLGWIQPCQRDLNRNPPAARDEERGKKRVKR